MTDQATMSPEDRAAIQAIYSQYQGNPREIDRRMQPYFAKYPGHQTPFYKEPATLAGIGLLTGGLGSALLGGGAGATGLMAGGGPLSAGNLTGLGAGASKGLSLGGMLGRYVLPGAVNAGLGIYQQSQQNRANSQSLNAQLEAQNKAAELERQTAMDVLAFQKDQESTRQREWQSTQDRNYQMEQDRLGRMAPYRGLGLGAIARFGQGISNIPGQR